MNRGKVCKLGKNNHSITNARQSVINARLFFNGENYEV